MRRKLALALFLVLALGAAGVARAQDDTYFRRPHTIVVYADLGIAMTAAPGSFRDAWNTTLPFTLGLGYAPFAWLEVSGSFSYFSFGNNALESKRQIGYQGVQSVRGGGITTLQFLGRTRFIGIPNQRFNPFLEAGLGYFTTSAEELEIENVLVRSMDSVSGPSVSLGAGAQYALNDNWSAYTRFAWTINRNADFAPSNLVRPVGAPEVEGEGNQQYSAIVVGIMIRL
ncbi:MAG: outer membrane beta-barrel protein [Candidatus Krumholzibacteria bacterium]|nr:outer membrane beta-barrel protein [Candidatus Krumholzibacteria bacterium]